LATSHAELFQHLWWIPTEHRYSN